MVEGRKRSGLGRGAQLACPRSSLAAHVTSSNHYIWRIPSQLAHILHKGTLNKFNFDPEFLAKQGAEPEVSAERYHLIFHTVNQMVIGKHMSVSYSDFPRWEEHLRNFENGKPASKAAFPETLQHFQNCLYHSQGLRRTSSLVLMKPPKLDQVRVVRHAGKKFMQFRSSPNDIAGEVGIFGFLNDKYQRLVGPHST